MGRAVNSVYLDFIKAFDIGSHSLLLNKLARYRLGGWSARWVGNWLTGHTHSVVINGFYSGLFTLEKRRLREVLNTVFLCLKGGYK